ncbi:MAG: ThiF family adenylyltransferase [Kiritimatiellia bacterium]
MPVRRRIVIYWASELPNDDFISRQDGDGGRPDAGGADIRQFDVVSASNLNRQFFFRDQIGRKKVAALGENLQRIESEFDLELCDIRLNSESVRELF